MTDAVFLEFESSRAFAAEAQSVLFFAHRGESVVHCYVTLKTLVTFFGADAEADESEACLQAYDAHTDAIQRLARHMLEDPERATSRAIVITTNEAIHRWMPGGSPQPGERGAQTAAQHV